MTLRVAPRPRRPQPGNVCRAIRGGSSEERRGHGSVFQEKAATVRVSSGRRESEAVVRFADDDLSSAPHALGVRPSASGQSNGDSRASDLDRGGDLTGHSAGEGLTSAHRARPGDELAKRASCDVSASRRRCSVAASARRSGRQTRLPGFASCFAAGATSAKSPKRAFLGPIKLGI